MSAETSTDMFSMLVRFGGKMLGLLLIVWLIALLTPKAAGLVDRLRGKKPPSGSTDTPERVEVNINAENYKVYSIFEDRPKGADNNTKEKDENG